VVDRPSDLLLCLILLVAQFAVHGLQSFYRADEFVECHFNTSIIRLAS
jgi:hypothetical protein